MVKITLGEMRAAGYTGILVYCRDYRCGHSTALNAAHWLDNVRLSDLELQFVCSVCGTKGAEVRPDRTATSGSVARTTNIKLYAPAEFLANLVIH